MKVSATPEARSFIRERGGLLFVWVKRHGNFRGALRLLRNSTEPPADALEWQRVETKGFVLFLPPGLRKPRELQVELRGLFRHRVEVFWEGCAFIL
jgi:hypothetical protein